MSYLIVIVAPFLVTEAQLRRTAAGRKLSAYSPISICTPSVGADLFESGTDCLRRAAAHLPISLSIAMAALRWGCSCLVAAVNRRKLSSWGPSTKRTVFR
jgi:hypothetical protein